MRHSLAVCTVIACSLLGGQAQALEVKLTAERDSIQVKHEDTTIEVKRNQDPDHLVDPVWAKTSRHCPPFCIQPRIPAPGVNHVGELEVLEFMENKVNLGTGMIIDARLPDWFERGTIPGSVNIPFTVFDHKPTHPELVKALRMMGGAPRGEVGKSVRLLEYVTGQNDKTDHWDFSDAKEVLLWCNGPWCGQSPRAIRALVDLGYPPEKLHYYRGGMQMWQIMGLTTVEPGPESVLFPTAGGSE